MTDAKQRPGEDPQVGSLAEETARLVEALSDWARDQGADLGAGLGGVAAQASENLREVNEHLATGGAECRYCPLCRAIQLLRETSPEVRHHLADAGVALLQAAAAVLSTAAAGPQEGDRPRSTVEHIDLDETWEGQEDE